MVSESLTLRPGLVGAARFELATFGTQNRRATRLRHAPTTQHMPSPGVLCNPAGYSAASRARRATTWRVPKRFSKRLISVAVSSASSQVPSALSSRAPTRAWE